MEEEQLTEGLSAEELLQCNADCSEIVIAGPETEPISVTKNEDGAYLCLMSRGRNKVEKE